MKPLVIYHDHCTDGFGAAWVVRKALGDIDFHPGKYQEPPPDVTGKDVVMVDFSYKRPVLLEMAAKANSILILDHHVSALQDIGPLPKSAAVPLSNGRSAYVDEADLPLVSAYSWSEHVKGSAIAYLGGGRDNQELAYMHHLILPKRDGLIVDHINRNTLDNRRVNLRYATKQQNGANMDRGSALKGVTQRGERFIAQITVNGENRYLGTHDTADAAARAYDAAAMEAFGEYARLNVGQLAPFPPNCHFVFDMAHSGAMLTWEHFFPGQEPPPLLLHIEDRDLWRFALQNTRQIQANVFSFPYDFQVWDTLMATAPAALATEGAAILRAQDADVKSMVKQARKCEITFDKMEVEDAIEGHKLVWNTGGYWMLPGLALNTPMHISEVGHELANRSGTFGLVWYLGEDNRVKCSLRSNGDYDVSSIARAFGGGGHHNASGFETDIDTLMGWLK